jgi:hypothetical protein
MDARGWYEWVCSNVVLSKVVLPDSLVQPKWEVLCCLFFMSCFLHHCRSKTKRCCELNWGALKLNDSIEEIVWRWRGVLKKMAIGFGVWGK